MRRGILIALLVPAVAFGAPRKKKKKKAEPPPVEEKKEEPKEEAAPTPEPPGTPTVPTVPTTTKPGSGSGSGPTTTTKPGSGSGSQPTTTTKPGSVPTLPGPLTTKSGTTPPAGTSPTTPAQPTTPTPDKEEPPPKEGKDVDVDSLRQEYLSLRDELFKSRARANAVASQLYSTRMSIKFTWGSDRHYGVAKASIRVDGATVYEDATGAIGKDDGIRFNGYVAPGRHLVTFHVEAAGKDDDSFTSSTESQVVVKAVANKDLMIAAKGHDSGDIAYEWKRSEKGSYGLGIDVSVKSVASGAKK